MLATGGAGVYLYKTNSFQMVEFTKRIKDESKDEMKWRDAIATSLVAISNQEQGKKRILRHKWGTTLGNWIIEDSVYQQSTYFNPRRSPYIIEALYALTERDPHFFCVHQGMFHFWIETINLFAFCPFSYREMRDCNISEQSS